MSHLYASASSSTRSARSAPPLAVQAQSGSGSGGASALAGIGDLGTRGDGDVKGKGKARADERDVEPNGLAGPAPFSTNLSSPLSPVTPIPSRTAPKRSLTANSSSLQIPSSPASPSFSSRSSNFDSTGTATPRSAHLARQSVRTTGKAMDLKAEVDQLEEDHVARGKDKKKDKADGADEAGGGAVGLGRKKSTMMLGGLGKGLGRLGSVMRRKDSTPPETKSKTSNAPGGENLSSGSLRGTIADSSPSSLSANLRYINGAGSTRSASLQGSLRGRGAPSERMGSVREEDDASVLSFARGPGRDRAPSAISHDSAAVRSSTSSRPVDKRQGKNRMDEVEGDSGITMPFSTQHDLHVSPELHDLPPAWLETLKKQGMSEQDLLVIAAARKKQIASTSRATHSNHGSFSGSISQLSHDAIPIDPDQGTRSPHRAVKTSQSLPRLSVSDSYKSHASSGSADNGSTAGTSASGGYRRSWLGKRRSKGNLLSPISSNRDGVASPISPGPLTASSMRTSTSITSPTSNSLMTAHRHPPRSPEARVKAQEEDEAKKRLSDQLRGFANLDLMGESGWAEGVLGLMQGAEGDNGGSADTHGSMEDKAKPDEGVQGGQAGVTPLFKVQVDQVDVDAPILREDSTADLGSSNSLRKSERSHSLASHLDPPGTPQMIPSNSLSTLSSSPPRSPGRSAVTPSTTLQHLSASRSGSSIPFESPPLRIASPSDRSRTSTPDHLGGRSTPRLRKTTSTDLLSKYGPNPYAPPVSALPSPPVTHTTRAAQAVEVKYSPRPPFRQVTSKASGGLLKGGIGKQIRPRTAPSEQSSDSSGRPAMRLAGLGRKGSASDAVPEPKRDGPYHRNNASMDTAASAEVITPSLTDVGQTPRPTDTRHGQSSGDESRGKINGHRRRSSGYRGQRYASDTAALSLSDSDSPHPSDMDRLYEPPHAIVGSSTHSSPMLANGGSGVGLGLGLAVRNESPSRLPLRSRRNTQSSLPASAADTDELFAMSDHTPAVPSTSGRRHHANHTGTPMSEDGEGAVSPRMSLKTYMFEPDSDDAYSTFNEGEHMVAPDIPDVPSRDEAPEAIAVARIGQRNGADVQPVPRSQAAVNGNDNRGRQKDDADVRLSLHYRTPPEELPQTPPDAPLTQSPAKGKKKRISLGKIARPLSFSAPYDSMRHNQNKGHGHVESSVNPDSTRKAGDTLSPLPSSQTQPDRSRRSSRASRASRVSRKSRSSLISASPSQIPGGLYPEDKNGESSSTLVNPPGSLGSLSAGTPRRDKRISAVSAMSTFSSRSGRSGFSSDSDLHDLRDLDDYDEDGPGQVGIVREARMTHVGAAPGRASIFALGGVEGDWAPEGEDGRK